MSMQAQAQRMFLMTVTRVIKLYCSPDCVEKGSLQFVLHFVGYFFTAYSTGTGTKCDMPCLLLTFVMHDQL